MKILQKHKQGCEAAAHNVLWQWDWSHPIQDTPYLFLNCARGCGAQIQLEMNRDLESILNPNKEGRYTPDEWNEIEKKLKDQTDYQKIIDELQDKNRDIIDAVYVIREMLEREVNIHPPIWIDQAEVPGELRIKTITELTCTVIREQNRAISNLCEMIKVMRQEEDKRRRENEKREDKQ